MIIFPAIDILSGQCVRLKKGEYSSASKVAESPFETAARFKATGAKWIHTVDLDGAKSARPENAPLLIEIAKTSGLSVEVGGGIRRIETVGYYLENGISRVILGSAAIDNPELVKECVKTFGGEKSLLVSTLKERMRRPTGGQGARISPTPSLQNAWRISGSNTLYIPIFQRTECCPVRHLSGFLSLTGAWGAI